MVNNLLFFLESIHPLSDALKNDLDQLLRTKEIQKKEIFLREGEVADYIYFIASGFTRSYCMKDDGEITGWFMKEGDVIVSVNSFYQRVPSYEYLQALEPTVVHYIHHDELQMLYKKHLEFNVHGRVLLTQYYLLSEERLYSMRKQKAEERYRFLLDKHPEIFQRASLTHIASYLGISLETLSRIRSRR